MNLDLNDKNVLITGASQGIGLGIVKGFLSEGANVFMVSRGHKKLTWLSDNLKKEYNSKLETLSCDCSDKNDMRSLRMEIEDKWGNLDIVVANVGDGRSVPEAMPNEDIWKKTWSSNFETAHLTARAFIPMLKSSKGCLLFVSSIAGMEAFGAPTDYSTAKAAINALAKNLARKLAPEIRVNVLAPGNVYFEGGSWDEKIKKDKTKIGNIIKSTVPMKRFGTPGEISNAAVFLCSDKASFITGSTLVVDGGQTVSI